MRQFDSYRAITLRANRIDYIAPVVCELEVISSGSGSGASVTSILNSTPVTRARGPTSVSVSVAAGIVTVSWSAVPGAFAYAVYLSSTSALGPFVIQTSNVVPEHFSYPSGPGTFWAKVTAIEPEFGESFPSPTVQFTV